MHVYASFKSYKLIREQREFNLSLMSSVTSYFTYFLAFISVRTNLIHSTFSNWWKLWTVTVNSLCIFTRKRTRVLCICRYNKVCFWLLSYLKVVSHIINIPRLLGLYGENIGPPGLGSRDRAATSHSVNLEIIYVKKRFMFRLFNTSGSSTLLSQKNTLFILWISLWTPGRGNICEIGISSLMISQIQIRSPPIRIKSRDSLGPSKRKRSSLYKVNCLRISKLKF